jgi:CDP-glycerol glycerophosphotransferase (TagB/SpsB family)
LTTPIKVVFLSFYFEAWDALAEVWQLMVEDDRFEPTVISIPRRLTGEEGFIDEGRVSEFYDSIGVPHLRFDFADSNEGLQRLKDMAPDYVFINYPWQRNYQLGYRVEQLSEFTKVCYVPYYSLPLVNEPGEIGIAPHLYQQRSHQLASLIFTQDATVKGAYAQTERGNSHVHLTGSPKIDGLLREAKLGAQSWPIQGKSVLQGQPVPQRNYRIIWAPHHSYGANWLNFGMFAQMYQGMLKFARQHPHVDIVLRPHPFLFGTLQDRDVLSKGDLEDWLEDWHDLDNTAIDTQGGYAALFRATDLMVTDGISFIGEFPLITGRPTVFLENPGHWEFSPLGEIAAAANIRLTSFDAFEALFDEIQTQGLPDYSEQIAALRAAASPYPGQAAARILDVVANDHSAGTHLVNKSLITQVAWEFRPGAEPQID